MVAASSSASAAAAACRYRREFIVLFPASGTDAWRSWKGCNAIAAIRWWCAVFRRAYTRRVPLPGGVCVVSVAVSIGVAERDASLSTPSEVLRAADKALYRARRGTAD
jgi:GGDEF domain-containing protein